MKFINLIVMKDNQIYLLLEEIKQDFPNNVEIMEKLFAIRESNIKTF